MADPTGRNSPPAGGDFSQTMPPVGLAVGGVDASGNFQPLQLTAGQLVVQASVSVGSVAFSTSATAVTTQVAGTGALVWLAPTQTIAISGVTVTLSSAQMTSCRH